MASRSEIEEKIADLLTQRDRQTSPWGQLRQECLQALSAYTKRDTIIYAGHISSQHPSCAVIEEDVQGIMEALNGLKGAQLDLIIHSNGGSGYVAEQIGNYLREKYSHIRAIVPQKAMSAATMMACACDEIVMGKHSAIGPIDPQFPMPGWGGNHGYLVALRSVLEEFAQAKKEVAADPRTATVWLPKIDHPSGFLTDSQKAIDRAQIQVADWLKERMLKKSPAKAEKVAEWLAKGDHKEHGRPISIVMAKKEGLRVIALEKDQKFQDLVLSVFHTMASAFQEGGLTKVIKNQNDGGCEIQVRPLPTIR